MSKSFEKGDRVSWNASQGTILGTVRKKLTKACDIKGHHVAASPERPEYLVRSDRTGAEAAHAPDALTRAR